ncbi:MAG: hypothetical protein K2Q25_02315 [Mycobacteriaceae bacterium]|nr:hypothetical protein [Mycobacteriaceae bacterium]
MTHDNNPNEITNNGIPRDHLNRPLVMPPKGKGKNRVAYQRTTNFVGVLENLYNLMEWKQRKTVLGMGMRKDLVLAAAAADPTDNKLLNDIAKKACEHAGSTAAATIGTALHTLTEKLDKGNELGSFPTEYENDLKAYEEATRGLEWLNIESFRVHDDWKVAGTADRIGKYPGQRPQIIDIKTGKIDYPHKMAMQLAMYAHSIPYDTNTDTRSADNPPLDLHTGIIIHLPAGQGRCDLYEIDISKGWGACQIARQVWQWRAEKQLTHRVGDPRTTVWEKSNSRKNITYVDQIPTTKTLDELRFLWRVAEANGELTEDFRAAACKRSQQLSAAKP